MKILVVGGNSSLGRSFHKTLTSRHTVVTAGRSSCDVLWDVTQDIDPYLFGRDFDVIVNTAANFGGHDLNGFKDTLDTNVTGMLRICELAKKLQIRHVIHISSMSAALKEDSPYYTSYAISKRYSEDVGRLYLRNSGIGLTVLRPTQIYGDTGMGKRQPFIYNVIESALSNRDIIIHGSHAALRNYIFIDDLAGILERSIHTQPVGVFYAGTMDDVSYLGLAHTAVKVTGSSSKVYFDSSKADICDNVFAKDDSLFKKLEFWPKTPLDVGLVHTIARLNEKV